jgi:hypothetical protein
LKKESHTFLKVIDVVRTMDPLPLDGLNEDVLQVASDSSNNDPELEQIDEKILPMLRGCTLAAKTVGRLCAL